MNDIAILTFTAIALLLRPCRTSLLVLSWLAYWLL